MNTRQLLLLGTTLALLGSGAAFAQTIDGVAPGGAKDDNVGPYLPK